MSGDVYMVGLLEKYELKQQTVLDRIAPLSQNLTDVYQKYGLTSVKLVGSLATGTANTECSDVDLLLCFSSEVSSDFLKVRNHVRQLLEGAYGRVQQKHESLFVTYQGIPVDIIPGIQQKEWRNEYGVAVCDPEGVWHTTNIDAYTKLIADCDFKQEINLMKLWLKCHKLYMPSMYLELLLIEYFKHNQKHAVSSNVLKFLKYLGKQDWETLKLVDPGNANHFIHTELNKDKKRAISAIARNSSSKTYWRDVIW